MKRRQFIKSSAAIAALGAAGVFDSPKLRAEPMPPRRLFGEGIPLIDSVRGRLRVDLTLFTRGGLAILDAIERQGFDPLVRRPTLGRAAKLGLILSSLFSSRWRQRL